MTTRQPHQPRAQQRPHATASPVLLTVAVAVVALTATTLLGAIAAAAGLDALRTTAPHDALQPTLKTAASLLGHNALVALWPLALVGLGWPSLPGACRLADLLVAGQLLGHGLIVGGALASHPVMWRYLPHLPLEWLAVAIPAGIWANARSHRRTPHLTAATAATAATLAAAALIETYAVPL